MHARLLGCLLVGVALAAGAYGQQASETGLVTTADRILQSATPPKFAEVLEVESLLIRPDNEKILQTSGLLQFRRLQLVSRAMNVAFEDGIEQTPLVAAWILSHREFLGDDPFSSYWYPLAEPYWKLYERFKQEPWAEELAWNAAQLRLPTDECYSDCVLQAKIIYGPSQYWRRLPKGLHINQALDDAIVLAKYAANLACYDSRPGRSSDSPVSPRLLGEIRDSLKAVTALGKQQLLAYLDEAERKCASLR